MSLVLPGFDGFSNSLLGENIYITSWCPRDYQYFIADEIIMLLHECH